MDSLTYALDMAWPSLLRELAIAPADVLRRAELPDDLFARPSARLDSAAYFRFWSALEAAAGERPLPLLLASALKSESFSPPLFAALCSPNLLTALARLAQYKKLVAPLRLDVEEAEEEEGAVCVSLSWLDTSVVPPAGLVAAELAFFVHLARLGTREPVRARRVVTPVLPPHAEAYAGFLGVALATGPRALVVFARADAEKPFLSSNEAMWSIFEPELRKRAAALDAAATTAERVRAILLEGLPSGHVEVDAVAKRLALSRRTLQRRLEDEGTSFQEVLRKTREALARHYLERTQLPVAEISFLLGFEEPNSFFRAFNAWTGSTPETLRASVKPAAI